MNLIVNSDYEEKNSNPILLKSGDSIILGNKDQTWPGWVWASSTTVDFSGYVPEEWIARQENNAGTMTQDFDPTVLTIAKDEHLKSLQQIHGWHWCQNAQNQYGWVAGYLLRPE